MAIHLNVGQFIPGPKLISLIIENRVELDLGFSIFASSMKSFLLNYYMTFSMGGQDSTDQRGAFKLKWKWLVWNSQSLPCISMQMKAILKPQHLGDRFEIP